MPDKDQFQQELQQVFQEASRSVEQADGLDALEQLRVKFLGRKGVLTSLLKRVKEFPDSERPSLGKLCNQVKSQTEEAFLKKADQLEQQPAGQVGGFFDYTLPGRKGWRGGLHPITQVGERIIQILHGMGFEVAKGPDVETDYYNFAALNFPEDHPARTMP